MPEARAKRKSPVRIAIVLLHREFALGSPRLMDGLVHHVIVEQRGEVGQLDRGRGGHDPLVAGIAEMRGEQDQGGAEPLPAGIDEMPGGLGEQSLLCDRGLSDHLLDPDEAIGYVGCEGRIGKVNGDGTDHERLHSSVIAVCRTTTTQVGCGRTCLHQALSKPP